MALSTSNVTAKPATTAAGIGLFGNLLTSIATNVPTTAVQWAGVGIQALTGLLAIFL